MESLVGKTRPYWENVTEEIGFRNQGGLDCNLNYRLTAPSEATQRRQCEFSLLSKTEEKSIYKCTDKCCLFVHSSYIQHEVFYNNKK